MSAHVELPVAEIIVQVVDLLRSLLDSRLVCRVCGDDLNLSVTYEDALLWSSVAPPGRYHCGPDHGYESHQPRLVPDV